MIGPDGADREAGEQLGELDGELGPEGELETFEDPDLNGCSDWEFVP